MKDAASQYNSQEVEKAIYQQWLDSGYFNPDNLPGDRTEKFVVMIAPPNVTGVLHMGHALENTISDAMIRYNRMKGKKTLWIPGTDHAGISTQNVVEKNLKKQGITRHDLGKEKFLEKIWEWKEEYGNRILDQLKTLGCSLDWSRTRFTMDPDYQEAVKEAFKRYQEKGLVYQGERVINWCIKDQTALSDLELEYEEEKAKIWHITYPLVGSDKTVTVATTRPETMLGDTAVAVNPKDERYTDVVGKEIKLPITGRIIPIIADESIDMIFGTGAVKVTPAHDMADADIGERHKLPFIKVFNQFGKVAEMGEGLDGLNIVDARTKVLELLQAEGRVTKEEDLTHNVAKCYRCHATVEPMLSKQWFVKMKPLAEKVIAAIEKGEVKYHPDRWNGIALEWLKNIRDWCISRQIWWGHSIPVEGSTDTFDTWFSSALWPFATLGWPKETSDLKEYYPTSFILSARDIIHLWIARMIYSGLEFTDQVPFKDVMIHATVLTKDGQRMSKSLGTGIDPLEMIEKYGADAVRFGLLYQSYEGQEIRFNEDVLKTGKKFCNKIWNMSRYVGMSITDGRIVEAMKASKAPEAVTEADSAILEALSKMRTDTVAGIEGYVFGNSMHAVYDFMWKEFADVYIEKSKDQLKDEKTKENTEKILAYVLVQSLKTIHPFMPFVSEKIWQEFGADGLLLVENWD